MWVSVITELNKRTYSYDKVVSIKERDDLILLELEDGKEIAVTTGTTSRVTIRGYRYV